MQVVVAVIHPKELVSQCHCTSATRIAETQSRWWTYLRLNDGEWICNLNISKCSFHQPVYVTSGVYLDQTNIETADFHVDVLSVLASFQHFLRSISDHFPLSKRYISFLTTHFGSSTWFTQENRTNNIYQFQLLKPRWSVMLVRIVPPKSIPVKH